MNRTELRDRLGPWGVYTFRAMFMTPSEAAGLASGLDALVAWGAIDECIARLQAHRDAGADHVGCYVLGTESLDDDLGAYAALADALEVS